jgi:shikimate dehydrogenase
MQVYCIISDERAYRARSTAIFSSVLKRMGIKATYVPFKVAPDQIGQALQSLRILNIAGANVTVPYKEAVVPFMDVLSEGANIIGAINTIVINEGNLKGYNTNAIGFMDALSYADFDAQDKSALVFGTGGAARAIVFILNWLRTKTIYLSGRDEGKVQAMVNTFGGESRSLSSLEGGSMPVDIIVNATSVSSSEEAPEMADLIASLDLPVCKMVLDLNYDRPKNFWKKMAQKNDIQFMDGLMPLAYQARRTFALWTGLQVPPEEFIAAIQGDS